ncbi:MAG: hypothetical protein IKY97_07355, partial [Mailhella sp.]|nr:hypothetical protein [Mailhella sp.]
TPSTATTTAPATTATITAIALPATIAAGTRHSPRQGFRRGRTPLLEARPSLGRGRRPWQDSGLPCSPTARKGKNMDSPSDVHPFWKGAWKLVLGLMTLPVILFAVMILADLILTPLIY